MIDTSQPSMALIHRAHIRWSAVFAGWVVALAVAWLFYVMGLAIGLSAFDVADTDAVTRGVGIGTIVWVILTWAASLFIGGMFASWVDGRADPTVGTLHGVAVWGVALTITVVLSAMGFSQLLQGGASLVKGVAAAGAAGGAAGAAQRDTPANRANSLLGAQVRRAAASGATNQAGATSAPADTTMRQGATGQGSVSASGTTLSPEATSAIAADLLRGNNDDARARLIAESGLSAADADKVLQGLSQQAERAKTQIKQAADQARKYTAAAMWSLLLSGLIALVAAALGGWTGAAHIHRVHDAPAYRELRT